MAWTDAQRRAIEVRDKNILVSAAAGSGKTAVLTERVLTLVKEGASIDSMLIVTFTKAAAAEMRGRIMSALYESASAGDRHLAEQALRVERSDILTLHGFCGQVCRTYFQAAHVDPMYRIADAAEAAVIRADALEKALIDCYTQNTVAFSYLSSCLSQEAIASSLEALYDFLLARPNPWQWLYEAVEAHTVDEEALKASAWMQTLLQAAHAQAKAAVQKYDQLVDFADGHGVFQAFARSEAAYAAHFCELTASGYDALVAHGAPVFTTKPRKTKDMDAEAADQFKLMRDDAKGMLQGALNILAECFPLSLRAEDEQTVGLLLAGFQEAVEVFHQHYAQEKEKRNVLDFQDLEHRALLALQNPAVAQAMRAKYAHVFIDEYQDSSLLQEALLQAVSRGNNLFMVGDVKQSIYRFRMAEPGLFLEKLRQYVQENACESILLNTNFRSHKSVLQAINDVFSSAFAGGTMELSYPPEDHLIPGRETATDGQPVELHLISTEGEDQDEVADTVQMDKVSEGVRQEAVVIADRILALRAENCQQFRYRDMAVLMRTVRGRAAQVVDVLRAYGIPAWSDLAENALERPEVHEMISLLQAIDNLYQDLPLLSALRGPAMRLPDEALAEIRIAQPEGTFASAMFAYAQTGSELAAALRDFIERVRGWALDAQVVPLDRLLRQLYDETGHYALSGARPDGDIRQGNLRMLAEHAGKYQRTFSGGLSGFLRYIERVKKGEGLEAQELGDHDDVVRVMSIHKSKGLQFPVVFVAGLGKRFRFRDQAGALNLDHALGIGTMCIDPKRRTKRHTISEKAILQKKRQAYIAEEARILYVAMTRAEDRLILVGSAKVMHEDVWAKMAQEGKNAEQCAGMLEWILPVAWQNDHFSIRLHTQKAIGAGDSVASVSSVAIAHMDLSNVQDARLIEVSHKAESRPLKLSVSAAAHAAVIKQGEEETRFSMQDLPMRPLFLEQKGLTASERGQAIHAFLLHVPLDLGHKQLAQAVQDMVTQGILSTEQARTLPMHQLAELLKSALWARMQKADVLHREWPFNLKTHDLAGTSLLQGVIDCCFLEDGAWVLVDYKSDRVNDEHVLIAQYTPQIMMYAEALEILTGTPVKERILYALDRSEAYRIGVEEKR